MEQKRKYTKRKHLLTREMLDRNKIRVEFNGDGQPIVYKGERELKQSLNTVHHKYGKDRKDLIIQVYLDSKFWPVMLSNLVWVYFNGPIPEGHDVDHINDNSLDNRLENLQLLTRKENLRKRGHGINQNTVHMTKEEREAKYYKRLEKQREAEYKRRKRNYVGYQKFMLEKKLDEIAEEREYYEILLKNIPKGTTPNSVRRNIHNRINALIQEKQNINHYLYAPIEKWEL